MPEGPFTQAEDCSCSMLIFVPEDWKARMFSDPLTGGYGYSHLAIDCGEVDSKTGKRVMIEATGEHGVSRSFQDVYGDRRFVRVPLKPWGVDCKEFCGCVKSKLGQKYDWPAALSRGNIENPAEQTCCGLAKNCLPKALIEDMAKKEKEGVLRKRSVFDHGGGNIFVTPNGFAEYFGAPRGSDAGKDELVQPQTRS